VIGVFRSIGFPLCGEALRDSRIFHDCYRVTSKYSKALRGLGLTLTTDNGTQFTSARYVETLSRLGIRHRRTAYNHPEGNSCIERFHRSLKEEEVWINEYQSFDHARRSIALWIEEYNHDRPHRGLHGRTPHESRAAFQAQTLTSNLAQPV
jgi:putative transposase